MLVQTQNGQIICNMDYLLSIRMEEKVGMSLLTAIPVSGDEISLGIFSSSEKGRKVLEDLELLAQEKNIKLIGKYKNITMIGSDILIYRLVYNLVENAIKYNHSDGQVTVNAYKKQKHIYLSVEDTGSGIPKELRERVFEPFFRVDKSRSREHGGVGLGLALVHEIVRVHDGSISIKSNPAGGTIFEVIFEQKSKE